MQQFTSLKPHLHASKSAAAGGAAAFISPVGEDLVEIGAVGLDFGDLLG